MANPPLAASDRPTTPAPAPKSAILGGVKTFLRPNSPALVSTPLHGICPATCAASTSESELHLYPFLACSSRSLCLNATSKVSSGAGATEASGTCLGSSSSLRQPSDLSPRDDVSARSRVSH